MKSKLLCLLVLLSLSFSLPRQYPRDEILYGVFRHDKWVHPESSYLGFVLDDLPERVPASAYEQDGHVWYCENTQEILDYQIDLASAAGFDFWTFFIYPNFDQYGTQSYSYGLNLYLSSEHKDKIDFAVVIPSQHVNIDRWLSLYLTRIVDLVQDEQYLREKEYNRPVIFIYQPDKLESGGALLDSLRAMVKAVTGKNPYLIGVIEKAGEVAGMEFDAVTGYTAHFSNIDGANQPYDNLEQSNRNFWDMLNSTGLDVVPIVNTGWDGRPLVEIFPERDYYNDLWYQAAPAWKIERNLRTAIDYLDTHPKDADMIMVSAWNENAEGNWLMPTDNNYRLNRLSKTMGGQANYPPAIVGACQ